VALDLLVVEMSTLVFACSLFQPPHNSYLFYTIPPVHSFDDITSIRRYEMQRTSQDEGRGP
jgi:hypothetical protein